MILGHEACGEIVEVGSEVKDFKVGDRVLIPAITPNWSDVYSQAGYATDSDGKMCIRDRAYIAIVRGTPSMIQVMLIYYLLARSLPLPQTQILGSGLDRIIPGAIALGLNSGAYTAEIFRSGIISIPAGQTEAGLSLGLSQKETMFSIVLPQALRNVLPAMGNEFITLIKESSVLFYIGVQEITAEALGVGGTLRCV